jgi:methionine-S-sulfoxide reductase
MTDKKQTEHAILGAGCFWGVQFYFDQVPGVVKTIAGYSGGHTENPTYEEVCTHTTGHAEVVYVEFTTEVIDYRTILKQFFRMHDPTQLNRQGPDVGDSYRSVIFYADEEQKRIAEAIRSEMQPRFNKPIVTEIVPEHPFYEAEDFHQKFAQRTGQGMCHVPYAPA